MKYIKHYKETPSFYSSYGSFMHELLEAFYKNEITREEMLIKFMFDFNEKVKGERPKSSTVKQYICKGANYIRSFKPIAGEILGVEDEIYYTINGVPFVGFIDIVASDDNGLFIVDHKSKELTGRSKRKKPTAADIEYDEMLRQLYLYAEAVYQKCGVYPYKLCFDCFRSGAFIEEPFKMEARDEAVKWALDSIERIKDVEWFDPELDFFRCRNLCGLHDDCCYYEMQNM